MSNTDSEIPVTLEMMSSSIEGKVADGTYSKRENARGFIVFENHRSNTRGLKFPSNEKILELAKEHFSEADLEVLERRKTILVVRMNTGIATARRQKFAKLLAAETKLAPKNQ